jgi:tight adherence protein B
MNLLNGPLLLGCLGGIAVLAIFFGIGREIASRNDYLARRLASLDAQHQILAQQAYAQIEQRQGRVAIAFEQVAGDTRLANNIKHALRSADISLTVGEYLVIVALLMSFGVLIGIWLQNSMLALFMCIAAYFAPLQWLKHRREKRIRRFDSQLAETVTMLATSMRATGALALAIEKIAPETPSPMSIELGRVVKEVTLNVSLQDALSHLQERIPSDDLRLVVTALIVQLESGGNIVPMLERISETIRERVKLQAEIKALTSQQQFAGYVIAMLPVGIFALLMIFNPNYILKVFTTTTWCGWTMFGLAGIMLVVGLIIIRQIVNVKA